MAVIKANRQGFRAEVESILGKKCFTAPRDQVLMEACVRVMDAEAERDHIRVLLEAVRGEIRTLAALQMKQRGLSRLVITRAEFEAIPADIEVHAEAPEPGVRIYELRTREPATEPKRILQ